MNFYQRIKRGVFEVIQPSSEATGCRRILSGIFDYYAAHPDALPSESAEIAHADGLQRAVCDYVAGMTDGYAMDAFSEIFIPASWSVK